MILILKKIHMDYILYRAGRHIAAFESFFSWVVSVLSLTTLAIFLIIASGVEHKPNCVLCVPFKEAEAEWFNWILAILLALTSITVVVMPPVFTRENIRITTVCVSDRNKRLYLRLYYVQTFLLFVTGAFLLNYILIPVIMLFLFYRVAIAQPVAMYYLGRRIMKWA